MGGIEKLGPTRKHGTAIASAPDPVSLGESVAFKPARLYRMARSKAYLFGGVEIRWSAAPELVKDNDVPEKASFHFPGGLSEYLAAEPGSEKTIAAVLVGTTDKANRRGAVTREVAGKPRRGRVRLEWKRTRTS